MKGHNTQRQLAHMVDMIQNSWNDKLDVQGIFLDIEGAFDAIPHFSLIKKLKSYGFGPRIIALMDSYLRNRCLRVKVNNCCSDWPVVRDMNSGVPQG
jgi:hypothetical protein